MNIDYTSYNQLITLFTSHFETLDQRRTLVGGAFFGTDVLAKVQLEGTPNEFTTRTVQMLIQHGDVVPSTPAIIRLMQQLRGTLGVDKQAEIDALMEQIREELSSPAPGHSSGRRIFISYARADDEPFVERLYHDLKNEFDVWWDRVSMPNRGLTFLQEIREAIDWSDRLVLVAGPKAFESDYVRDEWQYAYQTYKGINIILRLGNYEDLPEQLGGFDAPDFRSDDDYSERLHTLKRQLAEPVAPRGEHHGVPALPPHFLSRPEALDMLRNLVIADVDKPTLISAEKRTTAVEGMGGIGKSVLAAAFAHDRKVRFAFPDGIVWLTAGHKPSMYELYRAIGVALGDELSNYPDETTARQNAQKALADKKCLLILDDVWELTVGRAFRDLISGTLARLLITTRNLQINDVLDANEYRLKLIDKSQAADYLRSWVGDDPDLETIAEKLGYLFLALKLAGARMKKDGLSGADYLRTFDRVSKMKIDRQASDREDSLEASIALSVEAAFPDAEDEKLLYHTFGIFPEDTPIPQQTILQLWQHLRPNVDGFDLLETFNVLVDLALVERNLDDRTVTLHDLLHSYTHEKLGKSHTQIHLEFLRSYHEHSIQSWQEMNDDNYIYDHIVYHLLAAQKIQKTLLLFMDDAWMLFRVKSNGYRYDKYISDIDYTLRYLRNNVRKGSNIKLNRNNLIWAFRLALIRTIINEISTTYIPEVVEKAIEFDLPNWDKDRVLSIANRVTNPVARSRLLMKTLKHSPLQANTREQLESDFLSIFFEIRNGKERLKILHESKSHLSQISLTKLSFELLQTNDTKDMPHSSSFEQVIADIETLSVVCEKIEDQNIKKRLIKRALSLTYTLPVRKSTLWQPRSEYPRAQALVHLVPILSRQRLSELMHQAQSEADPVAQVSTILTILLYRGDEFDKTYHINLALRTIAKIDDNNNDIMALFLVAELVDEKQSSMILRQVYKTINKMDLSDNKIALQAMLAEKLSSHNRDKVIYNVVLEVCKLDDINFDKMLRLFVSQLFGKNLSVIVERVKHIEDNQLRAICWGTILGKLDGHQHKHAFESAFNYALSIEDDYYRGSSLTYLMSNAHPIERKKILNSILEIDMDEARLKAIAIVADTLTQDEVLLVLSETSYSPNSPTLTISQVNLEHHSSGRNPCELYVEAARAEKKGYYVQQILGLIDAECKSDLVQEAVYTAKKIKNQHLRNYTLRHLDSILKEQEVRLLSADASYEYILQEIGLDDHNISSEPFRWVGSNLSQHHIDDLLERISKIHVLYQIPYIVTMLPNMVERQLAICIDAVSKVEVDGNREEQYVLWFWEEVCIYISSPRLIKAVWRELEHIRENDLAVFLHCRYMLLSKTKTKHTQFIDYMLSTDVMEKLDDSQKQFIISLVCEELEPHQIENAFRSTKMIQSLLDRAITMSDLVPYSDDHEAFFELSVSILDYFIEMSSEMPKTILKISRYDNFFNSDCFGQETAREMLKATQEIRNWGWL